MTLRIVRLGTPRSRGDVLRIGTVRRPPRGVAKEKLASEDGYDVWLPLLAPSVETMKLGQSATTPAQWSAFARKDRAEMARPDARHALELLAASSRTTDLAVGGYGEREERCQRSVLRELLEECGVDVSSRLGPRRIGRTTERSDRILAAILQGRPRVTMERRASGSMELEACVTTRSMDSGSRRTRRRASSHASRRAARSEPTSRMPISCVESPSVVSCGPARSFVSTTASPSSRTSSQRASSECFQGLERPVRLVLGSRRLRRVGIGVRSPEAGGTVTRR
ncbi:MAG: DUF488 family protein [Planctomycetes bacterium]|nr:DUF488 family protein [Planctomycetota bacterium]